MADTFQTMYFLTRNSERIAEMLSADADVDVMKLSAVLANMLQNARLRDHSVLQPGGGIAVEDLAGG